MKHLRVCMSACTGVGAFVSHFAIASISKRTPPEIEQSKIQLGVVAADTEQLPAKKEWNCTRDSSAVGCLAGTDYDYFPFALVTGL